MWAGRRTGKGKGQRDRVGKTSIRTESFQARVSDLDSIRVSPYGPAACHLPHREAGHTTAPDRMHRADQKLLASTGASTHVRPSRDGGDDAIGRIGLDDGLWDMMSEVQTLAACWKRLNRPPLSKWGHDRVARSSLRRRSNRGRHRRHPHGLAERLPSGGVRSGLEMVLRCLLGVYFPDFRFHTLRGFRTIY